MSWLNKIFKGSVNRVSRGHYDGDWHEGHSSDYNRDTYGDSDNEDIDRAIALSLAEEDQHKGTAAIDTHYNLEEDEQLARALQESLNAESPPRQNVPDENVPPRRNVPIEDVPPRQYVPAKEPPPHVYPASGFSPFICVGLVLDAITQLAMAVSLVVWVQFGIPSASDVLLATSPYPSMSLLCTTISHTTDPATKSFFIQNAMFVTILYV
jgi:hypothetical protein